MLKSGPTPTNPVDEDVRSKPSVILNWSYERIMYNRPITSEPPIASKNTEGSISISTNGSYKTKIPRISLVCHINRHVRFFFFSRPSMYNQTITGSALAIILKTFLPQGRVTVWRWVQITLLCYLETFDNLQKRKIVFLWTEDRILNRWPKSKKFVYRWNG